MTFNRNNNSTDPFDRNAPDPLLLFPDERVLARAMRTNGFVRESELREYGKLLIAGLCGGAMATMLLQPSIDSQAISVAAPMTASHEQSQTMQSGPEISRASLVEAATSQASPATPAEDTSQDTAAPRRTGYRGSLTLQSYPSGAQVLINGQQMGRTPLRLTNQGIGSRAVKFALDGYEPWSSAVTVTAGRRTDVVATLRPVRPVQAELEPDGAGNPAS